MRVLVKLLLVVAATVAVTEAQRRRPPPVKIPSRLELIAAVNNQDTVKKALICIEGRVCPLGDKYSVMLRRWGPEIMMRGYCPRSMCTPKQAEEAQWLIAQISKKYPQLYYRTLNRLASSNPYQG